MSGGIKCELLLGDSEKKEFKKILVSYPLSEIWYAMPSIARSFKSKDDFIIYLLFYRYLPSSKYKKKIYIFLKKLTEIKILPFFIGYRCLLDLYSKEIEVRHANRYEINIIDPLIKSITDEIKAKENEKNRPDLYELDNKMWDKKRLSKVDYDNLPGLDNGENCRLKIDQVVNFFDIDIGGQCVSYIGKTKQEAFDRMFTHSKLMELSAKLLINEYESLVVHLFGFMKWDEPSYTNAPKTAISKSMATTIVEAELINYFKPNENFVHNKLKPQWKHIKLLTGKKYSKIMGLLDIDGPYAKYYTSHLGRSISNRHEINVDLNLYKSKSKLILNENY